MLQPGDSTVAAGTMAKAIYDKLVAAFGADPGVDANRKVDAAVLAQAICEHIFEAQDGFVVARACTTANVGLSGTAAQDGVAIAAGDIVLVPRQTVDSQNGLYVVQSGAWTRVPMAMRPGMIVGVSEGTLFGDSLWYLKTNAPITVGSTSLSFDLRVPIIGSWSPSIIGQSGVTGSTFEFAYWERPSISRLRWHAAWSATLSGAGPVRFTTFSAPFSRSLGNFGGSDNGAGLCTGTENTTNTGLAGYTHGVTSSQNFRGVLHTTQTTGTIYFRGNGECTW